MLRSLFNLAHYFIWRRPDKLLITLLLPMLMLATWNFRENLAEYKSFMHEG